jgi:hypothetical protein
VADTWLVADDRNCLPVRHLAGGRVGGAAPVPAGPDERNGGRRVARLGAVASPAAHRLSAVNFRILGRKQFTRPETALLVLVRSIRRLEAVS